MLNFLINNKDLITNICGLIIAVGGALLASPVQLGDTLKNVITIAMTIAGAVVAYFTGKKNDTSN